MNISTLLLTSQSKLVSSPSNPGTLFTKGTNTDGLMGIGDPVTTNVYTTPQLVTLPGLNVGQSVKMVSMGSNSAAAISTDGYMWTWGEARFCSQGYVLTDGSIKLSSPVRITQVYNATNNLVPSPLWKYVFAYYSSMFAVDIDGNLYAGGGASQITGYGSTSTRLRKVTLNKTIKKVVASGATAQSPFAIILTDDGELYSIGGNNNGQTGLGLFSGTTALYTKIVGGPASWIDIAVNYQTVNAVGAIGADGKFYTWGHYTGMPPSMGNVSLAVPTLCDQSRVWKSVNGSSVDKGYTGVFYLITQDNKLFTCGRQYSAAINSPGFLPALADGTRFEITAVAPSNTFSAAVVNSQQFYLIDTNSNLWGWGINNNNILGPGSIPIKTPTLINSIDKIYNIDSVNNRSAFIVSP